MIDRFVEYMYKKSKQYLEKKGIRDISSQFKNEICEKCSYRKYFLRALQTTLDQDEESYLEKTHKQCNKCLVWEKELKDGLCEKCKAEDLETTWRAEHKQHKIEKNKKRKPLIVGLQYELDKSKIKTLKDVIEIITGIGFVVKIGEDGCYNQLKPYLKAIKEDKKGLKNE